MKFYTMYDLVIHRHFHCITTHWCGLTFEMLQAGIKIQLTLCHSDILLHSHQQSQCKQKDFNIYVSFFFCLHMCLMATRVLNSFEEVCITRVATGNSFMRVLNPFRNLFKDMKREELLLRTIIFNKTFIYLFIHLRNLAVYI